MEEKIGEKCEIINSLEIRIRKEKEELAEMIHEQEAKELSELKEMIGDNISIRELIEIARERS